MAKRSFFLFNLSKSWVDLPLTLLKLPFEFTIIWGWIDDWIFFFDFLFVELKSEFVLVLKDKLLVFLLVDIGFFIVFKDSRFFLLSSDIAF